MRPGAVGRRDQSQVDHRAGILVWLRAVHVHASMRPGADAGNGPERAVVHPIPRRTCFNEARRGRRERHGRERAGEPASQLLRNAAGANARADNLSIGAFASMRPRRCSPGSVGLSRRSSFVASASMRPGANRREDLRRRLCGPGRVTWCFNEARRTAGNPARMIDEARLSRRDRPKKCSLYRIRLVSAFNEARR